MGSGRSPVVAAVAVGLMVVGMLVFFLAPEAGFGWFSSDAEQQTGLYAVEAAPTGDVLWTRQQGAGALILVTGLVLAAAVAGYAVGRRRPRGTP